jgi:hypothetical protein
MFRIPKGCETIKKFQKIFEIFDFFDVQEPLGIPEEKQV